MTQQEPMVGTEDIDVAGYALRLDRDYHTPTHLWLMQTGDRIRVGLDALTADTYGMLAQLLLPPPGTQIAAGTAFGSLEAAKFVGPLMSPCDGTIAAVNGAVLDDPELAMREPYDGGWLIELTRSTDDPVGDTVSGDAALAWYQAEVAQHREKGLVAE
jgi:glycine cleavage system H protein